MTGEEGDEATALVAALAERAERMDAHREAMRALGAERSELARDLSAMVGPGHAARLLGISPQSLGRLRADRHGSSDRIRRRAGL